MKALYPRLRHRVTIERPAVTKDAIGAQTLAWQVVATDVPAEVAPVSARELVAANERWSEVVARIVIRWRDDIDATMRVRHGDDVYEVAGVLPDHMSGRHWITLPVRRGVVVN